MRTLIIDDEIIARQELRHLLAAHPHITVCGEAGNATEALALTAKLRPDLLLLDIHLPGRTGFDFLEALPPPHPHVIFTTAHDAFALRAFNVNALDYLLKPIEPERLAQALAKLAYPAAAHPALPPNSQEAPDIALGPLERVFVREGERCWFVQLASLSLLETVGNHTRLHFGAERALLSRPLASIEARLPASLFIRANRSQIINLTLIEKVEPWFSGTLKVRLRNGVEVEFSRRQALIFRERASL